MVTKKLAKQIDFLHLLIIVAIAVSVFVFSCIIFCCCCCCRSKKSPKNSKKEKHQTTPSTKKTHKKQLKEKRKKLSPTPSRSKYSKLPATVESSEDDYHMEVYNTQEKSLGYLSVNIPPPVSLPHLRHKAVDTVVFYDEQIAEPSVSDLDNTNEDISVSAYGDQISVRSSESKASWLPITYSENTALQMSLIYSREMKYVAGKIIQVDGFTYMPKMPIEIKVHVVVLPIKKYALKTNWYTLKNAKARVDEYFKFKFKQLPMENKIIFRFRLYGRRNTFSRGTCMGECYVNLKEIVTSRGGLTIWRPITMTAPEAVVED